MITSRGGTDRPTVDRDKLRSHSSSPISFAYRCTFLRLSRAAPSFLMDARGAISNRNDFIPRRVIAHALPAMELGKKKSVAEVSFTGHLFVNRFLNRHPIVRTYSESESNKKERCSVLFSFLFFFSFVTICILCPTARCFLIVETRPTCWWWDTLRY